MAVVARRYGRDFIASDVTWRAIHTMRLRFAGAVSTPVALQSVQQPDVPPEQWSTIDHIEAGSLTPAGSEVRLTLPEALLADLDYWEVDPDWDGEIFHSAVQVIRPRKKGTISGEVSIPYVPGERPVCLHFVSINGKQSRAVLSKPAS
jgi:hypothetical protein